MRHYVIPGITYVICGTQFTYIICGRSPQKPDLHILFVTDDPQIYTMIVKMQAKSIHFKSYISKPLLFILRLFNTSEQLITYLS